MTREEESELRSTIRLEIRAYLHEYLYAMETKGYDPLNAVEEAFNSLEFEDSVKNRTSEPPKAASEGGAKE